MEAVLDAYAIVALLRDEAAAEQIEQTIATGRAGASWVNLGEVYYSLARRGGHSAAAAAVERVSRRILTDEPSAASIVAAAGIKARHRLSYAEAFAVEVAERHRAPLLTGDPEIVALASEVTVIDLRG
ncbi:MAG: type II toxin-antitoxin system VapC family toxin [Thermoleophilaceae bacterium]